MTIFSKLTFGTALLAAATWIQAAPPRVSGNRPVVIEIPVPDGDPPPPETASIAASDRGFLAAIIQTDDDAAAAGEKKRTPASELKRAREQLLKASSVSATDWPPAKPPTRWARMSILLQRAIIVSTARLADSRLAIAAASAMKFG